MPGSWAALCVPWATELLQIGGSVQMHATASHQPSRCANGRLALLCAQGCVYARNGYGSVGGKDGNSPADKGLSERAGRIGCRRALPPDWAVGLVRKMGVSCGMASFNAI